MIAVNNEILLNLRKEVIAYSKMAQKKRGEYTYVLGCKVKMPKYNINDIKEKYIQKSTNELINKGVRKIRAKSVSKHTINKYLEELISEIS